MPRATATENGTEGAELTQNALAIHAKKAAMDQLQANHPEEWSQLYGDERESRGLAREAGGESLAVIQARYAKRLEKLEKDKAALLARGVVIE